MTTVASQITSLTVVYSIVYSDADQRKYQSSASLAIVRGPVNSPHKGPVTRKMVPFDDVIMDTLPSAYTVWAWEPHGTHFASSLWGHTWWRHQMETCSALLAICAGNSPVPGEFSTQRPVTRSFDVFFDLRLNKRLSKQWWGWWFERLSRPLWRHRNESKL